jgi:alanyl-tRNA synthetase
MSARLYYDDPYLTRFLASVVRTGDDGRRVYLDRTAFYPTSGGQPCDTGTLNGVPVVDIVDEQETIAHVLASPLPDPHDRVEGIIDWPRRLDHMQQHSGQHLLSAVFAALYGIETVSVHLGQEGSTIDLNVPALTAEQVAAAEQRANELVQESRAVVVSYEDSLDARGLRKASEREGVLRIIAIENLDRSACGGTHVPHTGAIGIILIRKLDKIRGIVRLEFLCGHRALARARSEYETLQSVARVFSAPAEEAPSLAAAALARSQQLEKANRKLSAELAAYQGRERYNATAPCPDGLRRLEEQHAAIDESVRALAQSFTAQPKAVYVAVDPKSFAVLLAVSADSGMHAGELLQQALRALGGRGGGNARMAQGSVPTADALDKLLAGLRN